MRSSTQVRWLPIESMFFLVCICAAPVKAQGKPSPQSKSHQTSSQHHTSHPSHPMRNVRPKHHAANYTGEFLIPVRYIVPQQASSTSVSKSSGSPASALKSSGSSTAASSNKKKSTKKSTHHAKREPTQKAPTPERISEIQSSLARGGYYQGDPNGKWDANTVGAMQKFQSANGLDPSGKLDATSLQKLGLGSGIAGVSAPKPVTTAPAGAAAPSKPAPTPSAAAPASSTPTSASNASPSSNSPSSGISGSGPKPPPQR
jgi:hypothetical protein